MAGRSAERGEHVRAIDAVLALFRDAPFKGDRADGWTVEKVHRWREYLADERTRIEFGDAPTLPYAVARALDAQGTASGHLAEVLYSLGVDLAEPRGRSRPGRMERKLRRRGLLP